MINFRLIAKIKTNEYIIINVFSIQIVCKTFYNKNSIEIHCLR